MASLVIAALPVHAAATILLAPTSKSPIKAATTDVREDDFLRLPTGNVAIASLRKMRGYLVLVSGDGWRRGNGLPRIADHRTIGVCILATARELARGQFGTIFDACRRLNSSAPNAGLIPSRSRRRAEASRAYGSVALGPSRSVPDEFRELAEEALIITARLLRAPAPQERDGERSDCQQ